MLEYFAQICVLTLKYIYEHSKHSNTKDDEWIESGIALTETPQATQMFTVFA